MNQFSAEAGALAKAADLTRAAHGDLFKEVNDMPGRLATKGAWEGQGAGEFTKLIMSWNTDSQKVLNALEDFESNLRGVDVNYRDADDVQADVMRNLRAGLSS